MTITILYFASLREALGTHRETLDLPPGIGTAGHLRSWLAARGDRWAEQFAEGRAVRMAVDQTIAGPDTPVPADAEVAFFPPVTGG
jgi:molybdopterin synthase sulfur carrier subunit